VLSVARCSCSSADSPPIDRVGKIGIRTEKGIAFRVRKAHRRSIFLFDYEQKHRWAESERKQRRLTPVMSVGQAKPIEEGGFFVVCDCERRWRNRRNFWTASSSSPKQGTFWSSLLGTAAELRSPIPAFQKSQFFLLPCFTLSVPARLRNGELPA